MSDMEKLVIFDTTLRDGEQSPGCSMTQRQKMRVARTLADLGVDVIEAGFPAASPGDFASVEQVAREIHGPTICGLARCGPADIDATAKALEPAEKKRIHVFIATSPIHREHKLQMNRAQVLERAVGGVKLARQFVDDVEFSCEDAGRTEPEFLAEVVEAAIDAGASTINIPDTVGYVTPAEYAGIFTYLKENVPNIGNVILSSHCHDDLGMAVANSLAAAKAGVRQIECTINGIGERAGNCSLEEVVMAIKTRESYFGLYTDINTRKLYPASRLVANITGSMVPPNKAVVGENAFAHEAGIHQHGVLQNAITYEIMKPEEVGIARSSLVLGKHSGRHAFRDRVKHLGFSVDEAALERAFKGFKELADKKKEIYDGDIEALVLGSQRGDGGPWTLQSYTTTSAHGNESTPAATVKLKHYQHGLVSEAAVGDGPIDSLFKAIERATQITVQLNDFQVRSVTMGEDAQGRAVVNALHDGQALVGKGLSTDIIEASAIAFMEIINRIARRAETQPSTPSEAAEA